MFMENRNVNMDEGNASENYLRKPILRLIKCEVEIVGDREHTAIDHKHITVPLLTKIKTEIDEDRNPLAGISNIPPVTFDLVVKKETESEQPNRGDKHPVHQTKIRVKEEFVGDNTDEDLGGSPQEKEVSQKRQNSMAPLRIPDQESPLHDHSSVIEATRSVVHPYHFNEILPDQRKLVVLLKKLDPKLLHNHQSVPEATTNANNSVPSSQSKKKVRCCMIVTYIMRINLKTPYNWSVMA
ncbi:unnamed protein product [Bemisia tabaci]|uniref:Uncharacterized protein n=1 Tax=Bemisia tabaci TaxID=7038 RepID=A0A9P0AI18_BEMTA|nr:unnamed protein product [Bemisia tabaci]